MYDLLDHGTMLADVVRVEAYRAALARAVRRDSVVLDIGTGTGLFALVAARLGARKVIAIEPESVIGVARELAAANGLADRVEFHQLAASDFHPAERADVIVCDLRGVLPLHRDHLSIVIDARRRLLAPGGTLIPCRDQLWLALAQSRREIRNLEVPWRGELAGLDLGCVRATVANRWWRGRDVAPRLLSAPLRVATLDYRKVESADLEARVRAEATASGPCHGFYLWFDAELADGIGYSNAPGEERVYGRAFFPFAETLELLEGDAVEVSLRAKYLDGDYVWVWNTRAMRAAGQCFAQLSQTTFRGEPLSRETLERASSRRAGR